MLSRRGVLRISDPEGNLSALGCLDSFLLVIPGGKGGARKSVASGMENVVGQFKTRADSKACTGSVGDSTGGLQDDAEVMSGRPRLTG